MRCNIIAQRISLQEYLIEREANILKEIEDWVSDEEKVKTLDRATVDAMMDEWLQDFKLV